MNRGTLRTGFSWLDVKLGFRMLIKYPGLTLVGGLAMAFAIGAGAATFELVTDVVHPTIPLPEGERLVGIRNWNAARARPADRALHDLARWREELETVEQLGAFRSLERNLAVDDAAAGEPVELAEMSAAGFRVAQVPPLFGRTLVEADERLGAPLVVVIGHRVWQGRFGGDPVVVGRTVRLGGDLATVVGVMPEGFAFPVHHGVWVPLRLDPWAYPPGEGPRIRVFGRLAPGTGLDQAQAELAAAGRRAAADLPDTHEYLRPVVLPYGKSLVGMPLDAGFVAGAYSLNLFLVLFLALICANVGALIFARTATRDSEIAVRTALGASRARIVMQLFAEALVLGGAAAVVGLEAAQLGLDWGLGTFEAVQGEPLPFWLSRSLSPTTVLYAVLLTIFGAALSGVPPALKVTRGVGSALRQAAVSGSNLRLGRVLTGVIVAQVAVTVVFLPLVFDTGLETAKIRRHDVGLAAGEYLSVELQLDRETPPAVSAATAAAEFDDGVDATVRELERRLSAEPGVAAVTYGSQLPGGYHPRRRIELEDVAAPAGAATEHRVQVASVAPDFFEALGTRVLAGRGFVPGDVASKALPVVVNRSFVRDLLGGRNALGRRVRYRDLEDEDAAIPAEWQPGPWYDIVGVVEDMALTLDPDLPNNAGLYHPVSPSGAYPVLLAVHARGDPASLVPQLRTLAAAVDPGLRLYGLRPMDEIRWDLLLTYVFWLRVILLASGLALLLSLAGIYAVMSFTVARRTREIGIRVALGADHRRIVTSIFSRALAQVGLGVLVGVGLLVLLVLLAGGRPTAIIGLTAAGVVIMVASAALACVPPIRRALRIEPTEALRADA